MGATGCDPGSHDDPRGTHYENITERVRNYPIRTAAFPIRFPKDQTKTLADLAGGKLDIIVGTHRVAAKGRSFQGSCSSSSMRNNDSAEGQGTPQGNEKFGGLPHPDRDPDTAYASHVLAENQGYVRAEDSPNNRLPIETYIQEFSKPSLPKPYSRDKERRQVYYFITASKAWTMSDLPRKAHPRGPRRTAHGQLAADELEKSSSFHPWRVSCTRVHDDHRNGIDIPNVNTIIIDRLTSLAFLSALPLRGRVGRSNRLALRLSVLSRGSALSEIAMKRLKIISDNTNSAQGFKIALKDLEVRGAGKLLGREQSGDIMSVGFVFISVFSTRLSGNSETKG
jgi:transcription-repair coupling factor (superfamily II helicase)